MTYTIEKVATLIGARRYGTTDANIGFILTDSRSLCFPRRRSSSRSGLPATTGIITSPNFIEEVYAALWCLPCPQPTPNSLPGPTS